MKSVGWEMPQLSVHDSIASTLEAYDCTKVFKIGMWMCHELGCVVQSL